MSKPKPKVLHVIVEESLHKRILLALVAHRETQRVQMNMSQCVRMVLERGLDVILADK